MTRGEGDVLRDYELTACSTVDISHDVMSARHIPFASFHYHEGGQDYLDDLGQSVTFEEFYRRMEAGAQPKTSQPSTGDYIALWDRVLSAGKDVLHITLSSGISGAYQNAIIARDALLEKYPERRIEVIDSLGASSGYGMLVEQAADKRDEGASLDEVATWVRENRTRVHHWFFSTDLTAYVRGGRVSAPSAWVANRLSICPVLNVDAEGKLIPRKKVRTKKRSMQELLTMMEEHAEGGLSYAGPVEISYSACRQDAQAMKAMIEERFTQLAAPVVLNSIGCVIGSHTGPGTIALFFMGDERA
jgi:DegV family protein with EDD domain